MITTTTTTTTIAVIVEIAIYKLFGLKVLIQKIVTLNNHLLFLMMIGEITVPYHGYLIAEIL
jgi:hypothetical protein